MLPCCRRGAGVAGAAHHDHDGYSDAPGRSVLPDGGTLPRLAHAEKNSETACSRVGPRASACPVPFSHIHKLTLASLKRCLNPESSDFRLGRCAPPTTGLAPAAANACLSAWSVERAARVPGAGALVPRPRRRRRLYCTYIVLDFFILRTAPHICNTIMCCL